MSKRRGNKSAAIRKYLSAHPSATLKDIQAALAMKRLKASNALIAKVKSSVRSKPKAAVNGKPSPFGKVLLVKASVNRTTGVAVANGALAAVSHAGRGMKKKSKDHVAFIGEYEYYQIGNQLYRAPADKPLVDERRRGQFLTAGEGVAFALRMARVVAGEPE